MTGTIKYFNSEDAAKILGVNASTIKRWTEGGALECIKTAGGHRKFLMSHLASFVEKNRKKNSKVNLFTLESEQDIEISYRILKGDYRFLAEYILEHSLNCDREKVQQVLNGLYLGQYPLHFIYDVVITPVLHQIGHLWIENQLSIIQEHFVSQTIKDCIIRLQGIIKMPPATDVRALCFTPSNEMHDISLKMVDHILETRGFSVYNSGQNTPVEKIGDIFETIRPNRLYISSTNRINLDDLQSEINQLYDIAQVMQCDVYVGGRSFDEIDYSHPVVKKRIYTFEEVYKY